MIDLNKISRYYTNALREYGDSPRGVDWKDEKSQIMRFGSFDALLPEKNFSILDYGCGKGDYYIYLEKKFNKIQYCGVDISEAMVDFCKEKFLGRKNCLFFNDMAEIKNKPDYSIASGTFTVKHDFSWQNWRKYVFEEIDKLYRISRKGVGFNLMTSYVDFKAKHLFYMDPLKLFKDMKTKYKYVDLIHSYPLYEYTILIKKI